MKSSKSVIFCQLITHIEVVEVMGVVEVMEVTLLFVEVKSFQRSKSIRVVQFFSANFNNAPKMALSQSVSQSVSE